MIAQNLLIAGKKHSYTLLKSKARKKTLSLKISRCGEIIVRAPSFLDNIKVHQWILERTRWIEKQLARQESCKLPHVSYEDNSQHFYLGKEYRLKLMKLRPLVKPVSLLSECIEVNSQTLTKTQIKNQLILWYRVEAKQIFQSRLHFFSELLPWVNKVPPLGIRTMKTRWGSCSSKGKINLNLQLIKAPMACLDYVIVHELCHLVEFNHSPKFYELMSLYNPCWKENERSLKAFSHILI